MTDNDDYEDLRTDSVSFDLGRCSAEMEAIRAYDLGEIDLWIEHYRAKTMEEWEEYDARMGVDFSSRWSSSVNDNKE